MGALALIGIAMLIWGSLDSLDVRLYYSAEEARSFFQGLSEAQRRAYLRNEIFDMGFMTTYSFLFLCLFQRFCQAYSRFSWVAFVPGILDVVETGSIIAVLVGVLKETPSWLGVVTCLKWVTGAVFLLFILFRWIKQRSFSISDTE